MASGRQGGLRFSDQGSYRSGQYPAQAAVWTGVVAVAPRFLHQGSFVVSGAREPATPTELTTPVTWIHSAIRRRAAPAVGRLHLMWAASERVRVRPGVIFDKSCSRHSPSGAPAPAFVANATHCASRSGTLWSRTADRTHDGEHREHIELNDEQLESSSRPRGRIPS